ncbi:MAG: beta-lactamase family protein [Eubacterium sp.]|nr:beta-lactamase family protein [Eubacterium sp.]
MKKSHFKRTIALLLSVSFMLAETTGVFAANTIQPQQPIGTPFTDVTEEEALAFERGLEKELSGVTGADTELSKNAKKKAAALVSLYGATSVQYAVMQKGELVLSDAYGTDDTSKKTKVTTDSIYGVASISKMFATAAVMKLVEEGKVDLDQPVVKYIPEFTMKDARYKDITVRMLLNHSSGLMGGDLANALLFDDADTYYHDHFLEKLANETLKADPGAYSVYCNDGFLLAELVVERVSGKSFTDHLQDTVFIPLGLTHTRTPQQLGDADAVAGAYLKKGDKKLPTEYFNTIGTGGLYSCAEDLCRFGMTFTKNSGKLLSSSSVAATMAQEGRKGQWCEEYSGMLDYGLGWDSVDTYPFADYGITAIEKGGDSLFYHGELVVFPEYDLSVAVLSSGGTSSYDAIFAQYLAKELLKEQGVLSKEKIDDVPTKYTVKKQKVPVELETYKGYYTSLGATYKVKLTSTGLELINLADKKITMKFVYSGDGYFVYPGGSQALKFMVQEGKKYMMAGTYGTLPGIGTSFSYMYIGQKSATKKLDEFVKKAWKERDDKTYFVLTEKYSSIMYAQGGVMLDLDMDDSQPGYFYNDKIVDANTAVEFTDMPMNLSRDARNYTFAKSADGKEYLSCEGIYAVREDALKNLSSKTSFTVKISSTNGYAKWYKVGTKLTGKTIQLTLPKDQGAMVSVYGSDKSLKMNTYISGTKSVKLPKNGYVVFAGDKGAGIKVKIK